MEDTDIARRRAEEPLLGSRQFLRRRLGDRLAHQLYDQKVVRTRKGLAELMHGIKTRLGACGIGDSRCCASCGGHTFGYVAQDL